MIRAQVAAVAKEWRPKGWDVWGPVQGTGWTGPPFDIAYAAHSGADGSGYTAWSSDLSALVEEMRARSRKVLAHPSMRQR